jgi:ABC-2 type transport system ATP-binding protein
LQFADGVAADDLERFGEVTRREGPVVDLRIERGRVAEALGAILDRYSVVDMSVQDPPLDQMIARLFQEAKHDADGQPRN